MSGDTNTYTIKRDMCGLKPIPNIKKEDVDLKHLSIRPDFSLPKEYDQRNPKSITLGNQIEKSCHTIHTEKTKTISVLMKHVEGGWPEAVKDFTEKREVEVWKRKIEKHPDQVFVKDVKNLIANSTEIIKKNLRMDVYEEYFEESEEAMTEDSFSAKIKSVFKDTEKYKRCVSKVTINLEDQTRIAVSYRLHKNQEVETNYRLPCLIWDINNPNEPINILTASSEITTVAFNPKHSHLFGAGCANGTAVIFDLTTNKILVTTKLDESHSEAICDFVWPKSKSWTEFVTTSTDGKTIWWDIKNLIIGHGAAKETNTNSKDTKEAPLVTSIEAEKPLILVDEGKEYGGVKIEYNNEAGSNKYLIGTEQGTIFQANKKKNEAEIQYRFGFHKGKHLGPVLGMQRCPSIFKFFLTIGDWTARVK
jgi:dynein intermediate chain 2